MTSKVFTLIGSLLLFLMAGFHASGYSYVVGLFNESNAESFLKDIFPTLFAHPSIHLAGVAGLGVLSLFMKDGARLLLIGLGIFVAVDAFLGFLVGGLIPGIALSLVVIAFFLAAFSKDAK